MQAAPGLQAEGTPSSKTSCFCCQYLREIHQQIDLLRHQVESLTDFKRSYFQIEFLAVPNNQHAADLPSVGSPPSHMVENHLLQYDVPRRRVLLGPPPLVPYKAPSVWIQGRASQSISSNVHQNNTDFKKGYFQSESQAVLITLMLQTCQVVGHYLSLE